MDFVPSEYEDRIKSEFLQVTQTSMTGQVRVDKIGHIVCMRINGNFNPSAPDPGGNQYYTQIATIPDEYMPMALTYADIPVLNHASTRLYWDNNKLYLYKTSDTSIAVYQCITYVVRSSS